AGTRRPHRLTCTPPQRHRLADIGHRPCGCCRPPPCDVAAARRARPPRPSRLARLDDRGCAPPPCCDTRERRTRVARVGLGVPPRVRPRDRAHLPHRARRVPRRARGEVVADSDVTKLVDFSHILIPPDDDANSLLLPLFSARGECAGEPHLRALPRVGGRRT